MSGALTGPDNKIIDNSFTYPYGTTEQFPQMQDSDLNDLTDSAHDYMECSNKGKCNRDTGTCTCYDGYDGVSCQRASCPGYPNSCSGHGVCKTISQLAHSDNYNIYKLWDKDTTMGCECDKGYYGADCSLRHCKYGVDPLYLDDSSTIKYPIYDFAVLATADVGQTTSASVFDDGQYQLENGYWAIRYYDNFGEDWLTDPIIAGATCSDVISALENMPNNVIPSGSLSCTRIARTKATKELDSDQTTGVWNRGSDGWSGFESDYNTTSTMSNHKRHVYYKLALWETEYAYELGEINNRLALSKFKSSSSDPASALYIRGYIYRIKFYGNPGAIKQPEIEIYLDGKRPSLVATEGTSSVKHKVITKVWSDGQQGEYNDYFADHCDNVQVTIKHINDITSTTTLGMGLSMLNSLSTAEVKLLKACLGDSDFDSTNNVELYDWDRGSMNYPHIIKLVRTVTTYTDGGYYAVLYADTSCTTGGVGGDSGESCDTPNPTFKLLNSFIPPDELFTDQFEIYTTKGTLALTSNYSEARFGFASKYIFMGNRTYDRLSSGKYFEGYDGDISCEKYSDSLSYVNHCLNKSDIFTLLNWNYPQYNPQHINLYTAERLFTRPYEWNSTDLYSQKSGATANHDLHFMTNYITSDMSTNWGVGNEVGGPFYVYKFFPSSLSTYEYVAECSNRGICNTDNGLCECFPGYTSDSCHEQSSISL